MSGFEVLYVERFDSMQVTLPKFENIRRSKFETFYELSDMRAFSVEVTTTQKEERKM